jgi:hypothetical protein
MINTYVVDGDTNANIYGMADSEAEALAIARSAFVDQVSHVELYGPIRLSSGATLERAYVAFTIDPDGAARGYIRRGEHRARSV